jgi:alkanesulfonate monooxygenase SsuD/methylene tetrahydromethanopterin reductase-like flavin-dependent oxidoreductase (luciferase family)
MDIGLLLHTRQIIRQEDAARSFEQLWEDAAQAEQLGFDHIWLGDSVTVLDKARGDCLTTMAALAARTSKIKIGAVPMLPALRNPVLLAHALATLDVISKGRIILGVSVGPVRDYIQRQFAACGVPPHEKAGRLGECIEIMRRLWTEKAINMMGVTINSARSASCPTRRKSRGYRSGLPPTETRTVLSAWGVWATAGSR